MASALAELFRLVLLGVVDPEDWDWDSWTPTAERTSTELATSIGSERDADGCCLRILRLLEVTESREGFRCGLGMRAARQFRMRLASRFSVARLGTTTQVRTRCGRT
jgi:hypothetical protein